MYQQTYFVDKQTGTFADVCSAFGVATILDECLRRALGEHSSRTVRILDQGTAYVIELTPALQEEWVEGLSFFSPIPFIKTEKNSSTMPDGIHNIDYHEQKQIYDEYRDARRILRETMNKGESENESDSALPSPPAPEYPVWQKVNMMSGINSYNAAVNNWYENREHFAELLRLLLALHADTPNAVSACEQEWKKFKKAANLAGKERLNMLQVFNPNTGKGQNATKANRLAMGNVSNFWLCEYLKMVGFDRCALPRFVFVKPGQPPTDRKTFALAPIDITLAAHRDIFNSFRDTVSSNYAIKSDIFAALNYTDCFLKHCEAAQESDDLWGVGPHDFVAGMHTAFYKDLGNSSAVMNLSFINLPRWMSVNDSDDVRLYQQMIAEHLRIVSSLEEERSEGYELLQHYRDFLSGHDFTAFFDFTAKYPNYLLDAIAKGHLWVKPLSATNLKELLMRNEKKLTPIIESEGFQNIARAIRQSTVTLQYMAKSGNPPYDIRYGLGQELRRKANYPDEFIQELGDFLHSFNAENARVAEVSLERDRRFRRKNVRVDDITEIVQLIDEHGPQTVCHLLLAFGYASASHDDAPIDDTTNPAETEEENQNE
ncbi:MAG: hypothetical protein OXT74_07115 [Candidatus Poribacteria bacterium]|nr:hypothetical protein [Candidatus Poribacteria bacterium]